MAYNFLHVYFSLQSTTLSYTIVQILHTVNNVEVTILVPRPSPAPVFAYCKQGTPRCAMLMQKSVS